MTDPKPVSLAARETAAYVSRNPGLTAEELQDKFCIAKSTMKLRLQKLLEAGLIQHDGSRPRHYFRSGVPIQTARQERPKKSKTERRLAERAKELLKLEHERETEQALLFVAQHMDRMCRCYLPIAESA